MAKTEGKGAQGKGKQVRGQVARLERQREELSAEEARRIRQLARTRDKLRAVEEQLRELGGGPAVHAYCLRERRTVVMAGATRVVLRNGRAALSGTCESCGAKVIAMAPRLG